MNIFFDLDGVLIDPYPRYYAIHSLLARKHSLKQLSYEEYVRSKQNRRSELFYLEDLRKDNYIQERLSLLEHPKFLSLDPLYFDAKETLKILKKRNKLYLVTVRRNRKELLEQLKNLGIVSCFEKIFSPERCRFAKSLPQVKEELLSLFFQENKKTQAMIVGDTEADILTGKHYAMRTVGIVDRLRTRKFIFSLKPDFIINRIGELTSIVDSISSS